jgi:hypothetical protein
MQQRRFGVCFEVRGTRRGILTKNGNSAEQEMKRLAENLLGRKEHRRLLRLGKG